MTRVRLRPATREERQLAVLWFAAAAAGVALRPVWIALAPFLRPCTFRALTGIPCPTCGTTRTALALMDLDLGTAFALNPLAAAAGVLFVAGGFAALLWTVARWPVVIVEGRVQRWLAAALVGAVLVNWLYLIATG
jgi:hypothetical protein